MALPPHHPFWLTLILTLAIAALSAALVHARADRIVSPATAAGVESRKLRRTASGGIAGAAILFGAAASGLFLALHAFSPGLADSVYRIGSCIAAIALSLAAVRLRANVRLRGVPELVVLNLLWAAGFGWALPSIVDTEGEGPSPSPAPIEPTANMTAPQYLEPRLHPGPPDNHGNSCATGQAERAWFADSARFPAVEVHPERGTSRWHGSCLGGEHSEAS
jgi:hypothetical protein